MKRKEEKIEKMNLFSVLEKRKKAQTERICFSFLEKKSAISEKIDITIFCKKKNSKFFILSVFTHLSMLNRDKKICRVFSYSHQYLNINVYEVKVLLKV